MIIDTIIDGNIKDIIIFEINYNNIISLLIGKGFERIYVHNYFDSYSFVCIKGNEKVVYDMKID